MRSANWTKGILVPSVFVSGVVGLSCRRPVDTKNGLVGAVNSTLRFQLLLGVPVDSGFYSSGFRSPGRTRPNFELARSHWLQTAELHTITGCAF